jgi:endonuclease/exonuclease/phosphatase family metal-dependent hydrolase
MQARRNLILMLLALTPLWAFTTPTEERPSLVLMTWNIQMPTFTNWGTRRTEGVWPTMIQEHADIMCLQEVTSKQLIQTICHLRENGLEYGYVGYGRGRGSVKAAPKLRAATTNCSATGQIYAASGEHCVILWNNKTYAHEPLEKLGYGSAWDGHTSPGENQQPHTFWLTNAAEHRWKPGSSFQHAGPVANPNVQKRTMTNPGFHRICTWSRFRHRASGRQVIVYNTHLDHVSPESRRSAVRQILEHVHHISAQTGLPIVLAGDFNAKPESPEILFLTKGTTDPQDPFLDTSVITLPNVSGTAPTFGKNERRIDYVFAGDGLECLGFQVIHPDGKSSDHRPVRADLQFSDS